VTSASRNRKGNQSSDGTQTASESEHASPLAVVDVTMEHAPLYQSRLGALRAASDERKGQSSDDFFEKLRAKSFKAYDEKIKENRIVVENIGIEEKS
jgi:hypothetical protein